MLANWVYKYPNLDRRQCRRRGLFVLVSCIGLAIVQRLVPVKIRRSHNDIVGFTIAVVGVVYAVLLAFIAVATWETFRKSNTVVGDEASYVAIFRNTIGLPVRSRGNCATLESISTS